MGYLPTGRRCLLVTAVRGDRREPVPPARTIPFILVVALGAGDNRMKPGWPKPLPSSWTCSRLLRPASLRCARGLYVVDEEGQQDTQQECSHQSDSDLRRPPSGVLLICRNGLLHHAHWRQGVGLQLQ